MPAAVRHPACVVARELEVGLAELGELVGRAQACERKRRVGARVERHRPVRRHPLDQEVEETEERGIGDAVHVVERDDAVRRLAAVERVQDLGGDGALLVGGLRDAREQRLGRRTPRRVVRLERDEQAFDQALEVVAGVGGYPGDRRFRRQAGDLLREEHRLAVAGGGADQHDPAGQERVGELRVELAALDVGRAGAGRLELGAGEGHTAMLLADRRRSKGAAVGRTDDGGGSIGACKLVPSGLRLDRLRQDGYTLDIPDFGFRPPMSRISAWGNSHGVRLPRDVLDAAGMAPDTPVTIRAEAGRIIISPARHKPTLDELLALVRRGAKSEEVDYGPPQGREAL